MSDSETALSLTATRARPDHGGGDPGSTLYSTTLLVASAILPQMQGTMAATTDEIAWTTTFNILATAIVTPMTGCLVARFGRRRVMLVAVGRIHRRHLAMRPGRVAGNAGALAHHAGRSWRAGGADLQWAGAGQLPPPPRRYRQLHFRHDRVVLGPVLGPTLGGSWPRLIAGAMPST